MELCVPQTPPRLFQGLGQIPVTALIPSIPPRQEIGGYLDRAISSVYRQTLSPAGRIRVVSDINQSGSAITRNRGLEEVTTEWVAFLDDDDWWLPRHLATLWWYRDQADVVYPGCEVVDPDGRLIPHEQHLHEWGAFGEPFDPDLLRARSYIPVTSLVRTDLARAAGFGAPDGSIYDDWGFYLRLLGLGARFVHAPQRTWVWHHHGKNTSGQPDRW